MRLPRRAFVQGLGDRLFAWRGVFDRLRRVLPLEGAFEPVREVAQCPDELPKTLFRQRNVLVQRGLTPFGGAGLLARLVLRAAQHLGGLGAQLRRLRLEPARFAASVRDNLGGFVSAPLGRAKSLAACLVADL